MYRMTTIRSTGEVVHHAPRSLPPGLDWLQAQVGGWIELVPYLDRYEERPCRAFCNEEGKLTGLPRNVGATSLWRAAVAPHILNDELVGDIVIVSADTDQELTRL